MLMDKLAVGHASQRALIVELALITIVLIVVVVSLQIRDGAYTTEFGVTDDARHYITGLAFLDYLRNFLATFGLPSPIGFLASFHSHYPALGIGHWPPLFYVVEAFWMLLFQWSRASVLALSTIILVALSGLTYWLAQNRFGRVAGVFAAFVVAASPMHEIGRNSLMLDLPVALLCVVAMCAYVRYLDTGRWRFSIVFALLATAAIMVKGNGFCLGLLPPFTVLIGRRFDLLRRLSFWIPVPIVIALTAPWYLLTYRQEVAGGFIYPWGLHFIRIASVGNAQLLADACGPLILVAACLGLVAVFAVPRLWRADNGLIGVAALFAANITFQSVVPTDVVARYLSPALPALVILALVGTQGARGMAD
jgi:4-amino-4-deoxy-L-arabinose transferase-like glycosyltransferase